MTTRLYVGNLPRGANEALLRMAFAEGQRRVAVVTIGADEGTGRQHSFGTVDMETHEDALAAIEAWHGKDLDGRIITVNETQPRSGGRW
jgi:RNA recognition motif-containing protein